jgi:hypothetical protein
MSEGYVLHAYGPARYLHQTVASAVTIRRHDSRRPIALYASELHLDLLRSAGIDGLFEVLEILPEANRSIVGFKHYLDRFMPFDRCLFADADMVWCRDPDPLWLQLSGFGFTATGHLKADFWFGGPKGIGVVADYLLDRRRRTMRRFGLSHLPRVQAGMIYAADRALAREVCAVARGFLDRREETHFRSRLHEGRTEESCEWSLAMAMSRLDLPVFPWFQGQKSPQLDFVPGLVEHDPDFVHVTCRYYTDRRVQEMRGVASEGARKTITAFLTRMPGRGDTMQVTPFALHFGWLRHKQPYLDFAGRTWAGLVDGVDGVAEQAESLGVGN